jgi:glycosyltransferase involved in cell wall biosynthesis
MRKPSVVITYPFPMAQKASGGSRTTPEVARQLTRLGLDVTILVVLTNALSRRFPRQPPAADQLSQDGDRALAQDGVRVVRVPQNPLHYHLDAWSVRQGMRRILAEGPVDAVLSHFHEATFLPSLLRAHGTTFGFLATWQTYSGLSRLPPGWRGRVRALVDRRSVVEPHRRAQICFALSEFTKRELVECLGVDPQRIVISPLGVDAAFRSFPREERPAIRRFLFFGRLAVLKGFHDALEALGQLHRRGISDWTYRMFGTGRKDLVHATAAQHGIADKVEVFDPVDDAGLRRELAAADLAIMPSHFESFGLSIAEAQAAGLPVVAYAVGSVPEVVEDGVTGWLAPFRRPDLLAESIARAVADPAGTARAGLRARERAERLFRWERTAEIIAGSLERLGAFARARPCA